MMKKLVLFAALLCSVALIQSCDPDEEICEKECANGIVNFDFCDCECNPGWEYDADGSCTVETVARFISAYNIADNCNTSGVSNYVGSISRDSTTVDTINLNGVWDLFQAPVYASFLGDEITVGRQEPDSDSYFVEGTGTYDETTESITFNFYISDETDLVPQIDTCVSVWTKQ